MTDKESPSSSSEKRGPFAFLSRDSARGKGKKGGRWRRFLLIPLFILLILFSATGIIGTIYYSVLAGGFDLAKLKEVPQRTLVFDKSGEILGHVSGHGENRDVVPVSEVSDHFIEALLAREDSRFYKHGGVDYRGVMRAVLENFRSGDMEQGASTLTMQLARNVYGMRDKTITRKLLEVALAKRIERKFSKDEILGFYVNRIYFGSGLYGIERASQGFFMKPASDLTLGESAMLAGIIRGPSLLNPFRNIEDAKATRDEVLARMVDEKAISSEEAEAAKKETFVLRPPDKRLATGSYVLQQIHDWLEDLLDPADIERGGLRIFTTIDARLQESAEKALDGHLAEVESRRGFPHPARSAHGKAGQSETEYVQGAVVSIDNSNGAILAMVGGRDFGESPFNRAVRARRQCGSAFKPFVYAVAFDRGGLLPGDYVSDDPIRMDGGNGKVWSPQNSDGTFTGLQPAALGLVKSRNTMSVRVGQIAGLRTVESLCKALKFGDIPDSPVSFLGAFETTPITITSAYSTFPAKGYNRAPYLIEKIEGANKELLFQNEIRSTRIFPESVCYVTGDILGKVMEDGTGASVKSMGYSAPCYGKTGTTNDYYDAWFVGFTDKITTGVWVGMDRPQTIMNRGYGSTLALPVWAEVMKTAETAGYKAEKIPAPENTRTVLICRECGNLATKKTTYPYQMQLPMDLAPRRNCTGHGLGLFGNRSNRTPTAIPIPNVDSNFDPRYEPVPIEESGFGRSVKKFFRGLFGGGN